MRLARLGDTRLENIQYTLTPDDAASGPRPSFTFGDVVLLSLRPGGQILTSSVRLFSPTHLTTQPAPIANASLNTDSGDMLTRAGMHQAPIFIT